MSDHAQAGPGSPLHWYVDAFRRYAEFGGRSRRSAYWWFVLAHWVVLLVLGGIVETLIVLYWVGVLLPSLALMVRRLHDTDRSGWWWLINLVPIIGTLVFLVFLASDGTRGPNRYGPDPKTGEPQPASRDFCHSCGGEVDTSAAFCSACGALRS